MLLITPCIVPGADAHACETTSKPPPPHTTHHPHPQPQPQPQPPPPEHEGPNGRTPVSTEVSLSPAVAMDHGERATGAAQRRRERRLRAWQRHVRTAVQLVLAEKLHHSAGPVEQHDAPRRQKNGRVRQEGEEQDTYGAPRGLSAPLPGVRPGVPLDPGPPWVEAVAVG